MRAETGAVCVSDRSCDGESEAKTTSRAWWADTLKWFEEPSRFVGPDRGAGVLDDDDRTLCLRPGRDCNPTAHSVMANRVREKVVEEQFDQDRIADRDRRFQVDRRGKSLEIGRSETLGGDRREVEELAAVESGLTSAELDTG
jgi:hypothetical protein